MTRFHLLAGFFVLTLGMLSGCSCLDQCYSPVACCDSWDPVLGSCHQCGLCGGDCEGHTPVSYLKHRLTCASGCGEIYWGEWISDPPDPCDPCDDCGNWIGPQPCGPSCWEAFAAGWCNLWGYRENSCEECVGGCSKCGGAPGVKGLPKSSGKGNPLPGGAVPYTAPVDPVPPQPIIDQQASGGNPRRQHARRRFRVLSARLDR